jgi:predicted Fe-Mo cluster-binding NifX family protein
MKNLANKIEVANELKNAGIEICLTRTVGYNAFNLVYETYGLFVVNAKAGTCHKKVREFCANFSNINICINN